MSPPPRRVLIVEDDHDTRKALQALLAGEGFDVQAATDGRDALRMLSNAAGWAPDTLVLDLMMPRVDGVAVLDALEQMPEHRALPVILLTAAAQLPSAEHLRRARVIMRKPFHIDNLIAAIQSAR